MIPIIGVLMFIWIVAFGRWGIDDAEDLEACRLKCARAFRHAAVSALQQQRRKRLGGEAVFSVSLVIMTIV